MRKESFLRASVSLREGTTRSAQRGASTLLVVMLLFFVVSLSAAYAGRNLIFEQRTSVNQFRSTESFEAAEAGMEWAIAMMNGGTIDASCQPDSASTESFRQRNVTMNLLPHPFPPATVAGAVTRRNGTGPGTPTSNYRWSACVFDGTNWNCSCPTTGATPVLAAPAGSGNFPAFAVRFFNQASASDPPGVIRVEVNGCSSYDTTCLFRNFGGLNNCHTTLCSMIALQSGLKSPPGAPVTARGTVSGTSLTVYNAPAEVADTTVPAQDTSYPKASGVTIFAGGAVSVATLTGGTSPGTPISTTILSGDTSLVSPRLLDDGPECRQCLFASVFGLWPESYRQQPAVVRMDCNATPCSASAVRTAIAANPRRMLYLEGAGGLSLDSSGDVGTTSLPVVLVVEGPVTSTDAGVVVNGLIYTSNATLTEGTIRGAIVSSGDITGAGGAVVEYDYPILKKLQLTQGSFVRVPGSWRDFP